MAKTNQVSLYGMVMKLPKINSDRTTASAVIMVMGADRETGGPNGQTRKDYPIIASKDPAIVEKMLEWKPNDIVSIKGAIVTKPVKNVTFCERCGKENIEEGLFVYVTPIFVEKISSEATSDAAMESVYEHREISNELRVVGDLCTNPELVKFKRFNMCQYRLAVPRTYRVKGSTEEERTDFPMIKSYGANAKEDLRRLKSGAVVLIDGFLQTRTVKKETTCQCGQTYSWKTSLMEVVPYETEYLRGYITDKEFGITDSEIVKETDEINLDESNDVMDV